MPILLRAFHEVLRRQRGGAVDVRASIKTTVLMPLALAYCKRKKLAKTEEITRKLVSANTADSDIWTIDGLCHLVSSDIDGGLESLEKGAKLSGSGTLENVLNAIADGYLVGPASEGDRDAMRVLATAYSRIGNPRTDSKAVLWYLHYMGNGTSEGDSEIVKGVRVAEIPSSVTSIGNRAFSGCKSLTSVSIPSSVTSVGDFAFRDCDFDSVSIPRSVNYIGQDAFPDRCKILREKSPSGSDDSHGGNKGLKKLFGLR
jgi:hypothetical protein